MKTKREKRDPAVAEREKTAKLAERFAARRKKVISLQKQLDEVNERLDVLNTVALNLTGDLQLAQRLEAESDAALCEALSRELDREGVSRG